MFFKVLLAMFVCVGACFAQAKELVENKLMTSEYLAYEVHYGFLLAGYYEIFYQANPAKNSFELMSRAWSAGAASIYDLEDKFYITGKHKPAAFLPERSVLKLNEGDYKAHKEVVYNRKDNEVIYTNFKAKKVQPYKMEMSSPVLRDTFTALYYLRHKVKGAKVGSVYSVPIQALDKQYELKVFVEDEETIKTDAGKFKTYRVRPITYKNSQEYKSTIMVWVTQDTYMPVQIEADLKIGSFEASLQRYGDKVFNSEAPKNLTWGE